MFVMLCLLIVLFFYVFTSSSGFQVKNNSFSQWERLHFFKLSSRCFLGLCNQLTSADSRVHAESLKGALQRVISHCAPHTASPQPTSGTSGRTAEAPDCHSSRLLFRSNQRHFSGSFRAATWYGATLKATLYNGNVDYNLTVFNLLTQFRTLELLK